VSDSLWKVTTPAWLVPSMLFRVLLGDLGVELALDAADLDLPVVVRVVDLLDRLDEAEELGERLELRPLVVRLVDGDIDVDGLDDLCHASQSMDAVWVDSGSALCAAAASSR
jgi:hypothetical protein